jgi:hypothetical protein
MECPICQVAGSAQLFLNKKNEVRYARFRHYKGLNENKKPQFTYHKVEDLDALKTLLKKQDLNLSLSQSGQMGQNQTANNIGPKLKDSSLQSEMAGPLGFEPRTFSLEG